ncbi:MAG TPA: hypothetical protein VK475_00710 [Pyrinomonadaceae bacterium]|nr:hypothetical protein [Pyrinomonadaceae bacterium]
MKRSHYLWLVVVVALFVLAGTASAQSSNRDHPTLLSSGEITGSLNNSNGENFYSFTAGPGELTITVDVTVNHRSNETQIGVLNFELLGRDASTSLLCCEFAQTGDSGTGRTVKSVRLTRRQTVILHTTNGPVGGGTFRVRLSGASSFSTSTLGGGSNTIGNNDRDRGDRGGETLSVPESGILHIRMKNGTSQDIDLSRVRNVSVRP